MKSFVTKVSVGEFVGEGEGKSKKISKKNAAIAVLEELKKLPPLPTVERVKPRIKKKTKSIVRVRTFTNEEGISLSVDGWVFRRLPRLRILVTADGCCPTTCQAWRQGHLVPFSREPRVRQRHDTEPGRRGPLRVCAHVCR